MMERRLHFLEHMDDVRQLLMFEPRGHSAMSGAILQPPTRPDADWGVLYIEVSGCLPMCGHGTIGVATVLVETGMVEVTEPVTTIRLDTPAGLVVAEVEVRDGRALSVTLRNVPSFSAGLDRTVDVPGLGPITYDMAFGGNFYAILGAEMLGVDVRPRRTRTRSCGGHCCSWPRSTSRTSPPTRWSPRSAAATTSRWSPPGPTRVRRGMRWPSTRAGSTGRRAGQGHRRAMAQLHARGELPLHTDFVNESFIGTHFVGRLVEETTVGGVPAVIPTITGRAWITGTGQYFLADDDPFPAGFLL